MKRRGRVLQWAVERLIGTEGLAAEQGIKAFKEREVSDKVGSKR